MTWPPTTATVDLGGRWSIRADALAAAAPCRIDLPAAAQTVLGENFHGAVRLERTLDRPQDLPAPGNGTRWWLRFEAVATDLVARINGVEVGRHVGDYVPFQFEITDAVGDAAAIDIGLRVDELEARPPAAPGGLQGGHLTKGFHDVVSMQHGGVWQPLHLAATGRLCAIPDGVRADADPGSGEVAVTVELEPYHCSAGRVEVALTGPQEQRLDHAAAPIGPAARSCEVRLRVAAPRPWSPADPALYRAAVTLHDEDGPSETHRLRFGFRSVRAEGCTVLLNGVPLLLRGVLHWGHEPKVLAPAPNRDEVGAQFRHLRDMGFNCVCLCMWYPPRHFYDLADETGMLIWQEHPVWQAPMREEDLQEYRRLYSAFLRRDRAHPAVILVSATCEHPSFHPKLAAWWWARARQELPRTLLEVQTAFFAWSDPRRSDVYDEHTYDNNDRWVAYLRDLQAHLARLPIKPFVMGETISYTSWLDVPALQQHVGASRPWWLPRCFDHMVSLEAAWRERYGAKVVARFRRQGERHHELGRKFQVERLRAYPGHAGVVMNHLRDVPQCQCGFMDDLGRWRLEAERSRGWLADTALLLATPDHRRGFTGGPGCDLECSVGVANFSDAPFEAPIALRVGREGTDDQVIETAALRCDPGDVNSMAVRIPLPGVTRPTRVRLAARARGAAPNEWDLWALPVPGAWPDPAFRFGGLPFTPAETEPDDVERGYSRGYGLPVRSWEQVFPDPGLLAGDLPAWSGAEPPPREATVVLTHRLTGAVIAWLVSGGHVVLLASKAAGGLGTCYEALFGQVPLIIEEGPIEPGDSDWLIDLLGYDLTRRYARVMPVERLGILDQIDPLVRLVYTHDQDRVRFFDQLFMARVGRGLLIASSLDHTDDAGRWLLGKITGFAADPAATTSTELDPELVKGWVAEVLSDG
ncbi:MAG: glycoside hydrolase family 2 protein [Planctomycetota bacterium]|jgi:hypothetical protein